MTFDRIYLPVTLAFFFAMPFLLKWVLGRPRYQPLRDSGAKINMNLVTLWRAFFRKRNDPLKSIHIEICIIGHAIFFCFLIWAIGAPLISASMSNG